jgi:hypothetical protein
MKCQYDRGYGENCQQEVIQGSVFCDEHNGKKCTSCGAQAIKDCSYCGQFVCGFPLCENCEGWENGVQSTWGFIGHRHSPKGKH